MNVLIACEESQEVCKAFREKGHRAFSCDLQDCSGGHPEWHIKTDVRNVINDSWDLIIAHPPCTDLAVSGARSFKEKQMDGRQQRSIDFFLLFTELEHVPKIVIENPIGIMSTVYRKPDQIIQPWMFALTDSEKTVKSTCLWLKGVPKLIPVYTEKPVIDYVEWYDKRTGKKKRQSKWYYETRCLSHDQRGKTASKTFPGIAKAMAEQWG